MGPTYIYKRPIQEIITELMLHPEYVTSSIWTKDLVKSQIEMELEGENNLDELVEKVYVKYKKQIVKNIEDCYDIGFEYYDLMDEVNYKEL
jgi:hypothetical protein